MKRLICDMCKKEIEPRDAVSIVARGVPVGRLQYNSAVCTACEYDICNECFERIVNQKPGGVTVNARLSDEAAEMIAEAIKEERTDAPLPYSTKR